MFGHQDDQTSDNNKMSELSMDNTTEPIDNNAPDDNAVAADSTHDEPSSAPLPATNDDNESLTTDSSIPVTNSGSSDDLIDIKREALQQLSPLVGHLDQTPEEKFKTTMMMIQATDNQSLIKTAYEAAQQISDEKARAQALLDVINEINYFTQHSAKD